MEFSNKDWRLFRERLPCWQEAYMERLNDEYVKLLSGEGAPSEKFWQLEKRIRQDKLSPGVVVQLRKRDLALHLAALINDGAITPDDIIEFSDELREVVLRLCGSNT